MYIVRDKNRAFQHATDFFCDIFKVWRVRKHVRTDTCESLNKLGNGLMWLHERLKFPNNAAVLNLNDGNINDAVAEWAATRGFYVYKRKYPVVHDCVVFSHHFYLDASVFVNAIWYTDEIFHTYKKTLC